jgi:Domain of unknown function (DUF4234)
MGEEFSIAGSSGRFKVRSPIWVGVWSLVTVGIYSIVWVYKTAREVSDYGKAKNYDLGQNPTNTGLAVFPGGLIIVPAIIAFIRHTRRIQQAERVAGGSDVLNGWIALILYLVFSPFYFAYLQNELNKVWAAEGGPVPSGAAALPPRLDQPAPDAPGPAPERVGEYAPPVPDAPPPTPEAPPSEDPPPPPAAG